MKIASKDFCTLTAVYIAIYMGPCRRPYIPLVREFQTSKMLGKCSPTSKLSGIKLSHYLDGRYIFFHLYESPPVCFIYQICVLISSDLFPCLLWLNFEYWITCKLGWFRCKCVTDYVLHNFSNVLADWYFSWLYLNFHWLSFCGVFPLCIFSWV